MAAVLEPYQPRNVVFPQVNSVFNQEVSKQVGSTIGNGWIGMG